MPIRNLFEVSRVTRVNRKLMSGENVVEVELVAMRDVNVGDLGESFAESKPNGNLQIEVTNPEMTNVFYPGQEFYLSLIPK